MSLLNVGAGAAVAAAGTSARIATMKDLMNRSSRKIAARDHQDLSALVRCCRKGRSSGRGRAPRPSEALAVTVERSAALARLLLAARALLRTFARGLLRGLGAALLAGALLRGLLDRPLHLASAA